MDQQQQETFNEAPAVAFTQLYAEKNGQVIQFNLTVRANSGPQAIDNLIDGIRYAGEKYKMTTTRPDVSVPGPGPTAPAPGGQQQAAPANNGGPVSGTIFATKLEIVPEADDKVTLKFYAAGHEYPDITSKRTTAAALALLQTSGDAWEESHLYRVQTRQIAYKVYYRESTKLNQKGKPYKDIEALAK